MNTRTNPESGQDYPADHIFHYNDQNLPDYVLKKRPYRLVRMTNSLDDSGQAICYYTGLEVVFIDRTKIGQSFWVANEATIDHVVPNRHRLTHIRQHRTEVVVASRIVNNMLGELAEDTKKTIKQDIEGLELTGMDKSQRREYVMTYLKLMINWYGNDKIGRTLKAPGHRHMTLRSPNMSEQTPQTHVRLIGPSYRSGTTYRKVWAQNNERTED